MMTIKPFIFLLLVVTGFAVLAADDIYVYPNRGQGAEQQSRDRYECHVWAAAQSGFDPSAYYSGAAGPVHAASAPGGRYSRRNHGLDPISGAAGGAALGALGGAIGGDTGKGAAIGAGVGALAGIFNAAGNGRYRRGHYGHTRGVDHHLAARFAEGQANYRRAISACLEAHGYTVR